MLLSGEHIASVQVAKFNKPLHTDHYIPKVATPALYQKRK